ncbi:MAG: hypothetical protein DI570_17210 [Phenylobacterium zucineum]|nr:MAG: hypothetical protein DI570_17210 [Phenylobacterium zucineum]
MQQALNGKFLVLFGVVIILPALALLYLQDGFTQTHEPRHPDEIEAVAIARAYILGVPSLREGAANAPRIAEVRGQWEVHFPPPPPWGSTGTGGPMITVDKTSGEIVRVRASD